MNFRLTDSHEYIELDEEIAQFYMSLKPAQQQKLLKWAATEVCEDDEIRVVDGKPNFSKTEAERFLFTQPLIILQGVAGSLDN